MSRSFFILPAAIAVCAASGIFHATPASAAPVGASCHSDDANHLCVSLKYVAYKDSNGAAVATEADAQANLQTINSLWNQCGIAFQIDDYQAVNPTDAHQKFATANNSELDGIRKAYTTDTSLLVVTTGTWDRNGSLGNTGANAWTSMPGSEPYGAILEKEVATDANVIAHELGHYLDLDHADDKAQLMNPIIYKSSTKLTDNECKTAREAVTHFWQKMQR